MTDEHVVVISTTDSAERAAELAKAIVGARLAACVQISSPIRSVYRWDGAVQDDQEWQLWIKSARDRLEELTAFIKANHSYDTPEVVALPILGGNPDYLRWITEETRADSGN
ncbi:divalent-cation tolerance protein CutA [Actinosynnema sp. NPDC020468]|uniref:divalent-cation tolerance protein CutA n=1 Tax=Actinosynnema sp. NPDC020468 TaxID=3154488 RepID=UPI0033D62C90